jgi:hypothetical protein
MGADDHVEEFPVQHWFDLEASSPRLSSSHERGTIRNSALSLRRRHADVVAVLTGFDSGALSWAASMPC